MGLFDTYKGLPKTIYILFFVQIVNRFGDFVVPFLTMLLVNKLGFSMTQAGFVVTLCALAIIPGAMTGGKLSDHFGRKNIYLIFQTSSAVLLLTCGFIPTSKLMVVLIILSAFFSGGIRPILSAIITDVLPPERRQAGFSLSYLGINLGVAFGPLVAGFLFNHFLPLLFIGDALTSFAAVGLVLTQIKESKPEIKKDSERTSKSGSYDTGELEKAEQGSLFSVLIKRPEILIFLLINVLFSIAYGQHTFGLPVQLGKQFGSIGSSYFGVLMSINALTVVLLTLPLNHFMRHVKPIKTIALSGVLYAIGFGMIGMIHHMTWYVISTLIWSIGEIMLSTSFGVYLANRSPENFRARINAVTTFFFASGTVIATSGMGIYTDIFGLPMLWPLLFVLCMIGAFGMNLLKE